MSLLTCLFCWVLAFSLAQHPAAKLHLQWEHPQVDHIHIPTLRNPPNPWTSYETVAQKKSPRTLFPKDTAKYLRLHNAFNLLLYELRS